MPIPASYLSHARRSPRWRLLTVTLPSFLSRLPRLIGGLFALYRVKRAVARGEGYGGLVVQRLLLLVTLGL